MIFVFYDSSKRLVYQYTHNHIIHLHTNIVIS